MHHTSTLKGKLCHIDEILDTDYTGNCRDYNFWCSQWQKIENDKISILLNTSAVLLAQLHRRNKNKMNTCHNITQMKQFLHFNSLVDIKYVDIVLLRSSSSCSFSPCLLEFICTYQQQFPNCHSPHHTPTRNIYLLPWYLTPYFAGIIFYSLSILQGPLLLTWFNFNPSMDM